MIPLARNYFDPAAHLASARPRDRQRAAERAGLRAVSAPPRERRMRSSSIDGPAASIFVSNDRASAAPPTKRNLRASWHEAQACLTRQVQPTDPCLGIRWSTDTALSSTQALSFFRFCQHRRINAHDLICPMRFSSLPTPQPRAIHRTALGMLPPSLAPQRASRRRRTLTLASWVSRASGAPWASVSKSCLA